MERQRLERRASREKVVSSDLHSPSLSPSAASLRPSAEEEAEEAAETSEEAAAAEEEEEERVREFSSLQLELVRSSRGSAVQ